MTHKKDNIWQWALFTGIPLLVFFFSLMLGRFDIAPFMTLKILFSKILGLQADWPPVMEKVVIHVRLVRVLAVMLVGAGLSVSGASFQGPFRNPLVSPYILGDAEARSLGLETGRLKAVVVLCATLITSSAVAICGIIGWVGLIIPHIARMFVGPDHGKMIPVSLWLGAVYLVLIDDVARSLSAAEIPIGILTAVLTTHLPDQALLLNATVAIMKDQTFMAVGPAQQVITVENLKAAYGIDVQILTSDDGQTRACVPVKNSA